MRRCGAGWWGGGVWDVLKGGKRHDRRGLLAARHTAARGPHCGGNCESVVTPTLPSLPHGCCCCRCRCRYVASHEKDAPGCSARGGHYPTKMAMSPPEPPPPGEAGGAAAKTLVHWCHGAPGAVFLWCKAHEVRVCVCMCLFV